MLRILLAPLAALLLLGIGSARAEPPAPAAPRPPVLEAVWIEVAGLTAPHSEAVAAALRGVAGVREVAWTVPLAETKVVREQGKAADADLVAAVANAGFRAARVPIASSLFTFVTPLRCGNCVAGVKKALNAVKGTKDITVAEDKTAVRVAFDTRATTEAALRKALGETRYPVQGAP